MVQCTDKLSVLERPGHQVRLDDRSGHHQPPAVPGHPFVQPAPGGDQHIDALPPLHRSPEHHQLLLRLSPAGCHGVRDQHHGVSRDESPGDGRRVVGERDQQCRGAEHSPDQTRVGISERAEFASVQVRDRGESPGAGQKQQRSFAHE
jgi:hypothetical protein